MAYLAFLTIVFQPLMRYNSYIIIKEFKPSAYIYSAGLFFRYRGEFMGSNVKTYTKKELVGYLAGMFGQNRFNRSLFLFPECHLPSGNGAWLDNDNCQNLGCH